METFEERVRRVLAGMDAVQAGRIAAAFEEEAAVGEREVDIPLPAVTQIADGWRALAEERLRRIHDLEVEVERQPVLPRIGAVYCPMGCGCDLGEVEAADSRECGCWGPCTAVDRIEWGDTIVAVLEVVRDYPGFSDSKGGRAALAEWQDRRAALMEGRLRWL